MEIRLEIHSEAATRALAEYPEGAQRGLTEAIGELLTLVEDAQIKAYTESSNPAPPPGSTYERSFTLKGSSQRRPVQVSGPKIEGVWFTDLSYAPFVLGQLEDQAAIHRGRWKSLEEVKQEVEGKALPIVEKHLPKTR